MYLLGYDIGSSSVKASLVDAQTGRCAATSFYPKSEAAIIAVKPGWAEQEPASWWENLKLSTNDIMSESKVCPKDIKAIGISYQMHGLVCGQGWKCPASIYNMVRLTCCPLWPEGVRCHRT